MQDTNGQITLHVAMHPHATELPHGGYLDAEVNLDAVPIDRDLQPGDRLTVSVAQADGEIIGTATMEVGGIAFKPLKMERRTVGQTRVHKTSIVFDENA